MTAEVAHLLARKGAAKIAQIPPEVLLALNAGLMETVNLNEYLAIDLAVLAQNVAGHMGLDPQAERLVDTLAMLSAFKPMQRHSHVARALYDMTAASPQADVVAQRLATHASDVARCWATYWVRFSGLSLADRLGSVRRFAADPHFGVRELAWMAVRDAVACQLDEALALLQPWTLEPDENLRRFASELTRPRGVWCAQIDALKREPWRAQALLEPLRADPSRYVQNSVANWLNDAGKSQAEWVQTLCVRWTTESPVPATTAITRRALRSL